VIDDARKSLNSSLATGRYDNQAVLSQVKTNQDLLDMASKLESINADFDNYSKAQDNVARVQEQMGVSFAELGIKLDTTAAEIAALAKKDWTVYVNGSSVSSYGEMVSAMNRGMQ
jgi:biopolymer transport protein ExbD